ncbi:lipocalin/fatty-acid binding family protein [Streptomyces sp. NPDC059982]|uniref:lipocalin/fatty-acid binding family protein n=1 Tax=unclassified Streptomyces TaxID=2593676 RepID=UPI003675074D
MAIKAGKWEMTSSDNYGEYLKAIGVGMIQRNLAEKAVPTEELTGGPDTWELAISTALKNTKVAFTLGEPFDTTTEDGRTVSVMFTGDGDRLTETRKAEGDATTQVREYGPDGMTATYSAKGVTATRVFKHL